MFWKSLATIAAFSLLLTASVADARWQVDGRPLVRGARLPWFPPPGRHQIALVDARGSGLRTRR